MWYKLITELIGTLFLSYIIFKTENYVLISMALAIAVVLGGPISGAAFNPAISLAMYYNNKLNMMEVIGYVIWNHCVIHLHNLYNCDIVGHFRFMLLVRLLCTQLTILRALSAVGVPEVCLPEGV